MTEAEIRQQKKARDHEMLNLKNSVAEPLHDAIRDGVITRTKAWVMLHDLAKEFLKEKA